MSNQHVRRQQHPTAIQHHKDGINSTPAANDYLAGDTLDLEGAAVVLKCCKATIKRRAAIQNIPHKRIGSLWRFSRLRLEAWMREDAA
jgi:excisionase family DNA binding protein